MGFLKLYVLGQFPLYHYCTRSFICAIFSPLQEEMEEGAQTTIYDDFKFLTKEDLERLNLTNLIGTNLLRAYMHGFFIDYRLYKKVMTLIICVVLFFDLMLHCLK